MTTFNLAGFGAIEAPPITLADSADSVTVGARFTNGVLWMTAGQKLQLSARFTNQGSNRRRLILSGTFSPAAKLAGSQLELDDIELSIPFSGATPTLDDGRAVTGSGGVRWVLPTLATRLGLTEIGFDLTVETDDGETTFGLALAAPVAIPNAYLQIDDGTVALTVLPAEQVFEIALQGNGGLNSAGRTKVKNTLKPLFGNIDPLASVPSSVAFRRRFHLASGGMPDIAVPTGPALVSLLPDWEGGMAPPLILPLPEGLGVDLGLPELSMGFDDSSPAPTDFGIRLTDCGLHFPQLGAMPAFDLAGVLEVVKQGSETALRLQPSLPGGVDLPGFVAFFVSRLRWLADAANLDQLAEQLQLSLSELEWEQLFRGLLNADGTLPSGFDAALSTLFDEAIDVLTPGTPVERVFLVAFSAFEDVADDVYGRLWQALLDLAGDPRLTGGIGDTIAAVLQLLSDSPNIMRPAVKALFEIPTLDLDGILTALVELGLERLNDARAFLNLLMHALAGAIGNADPGRLAIAFMDLAVAGDDPSTNVSVPALIGAPGIVQTPDFELPAVPALLMSALGGLVASIPGFVPRLPTSDSLYEVIRNIAGGLGEVQAMTGIDQLFDIDKMTKLIGAIIDYSAADLDRELMLLRTSRMPVLGAAVTIMATVKAALTNALPWWDLMGSNIEHDPKFDTKVLPRPGTDNPDAGSGKRKYLIFSDVHRDKTADDRGFLNFGSIDHFMHNHDLYARVLDWADDEGYTVIEAGDCEELWYIRDFADYDGPAAEMAQIVAANGMIYDKLKGLHENGRFYRVKGNHDSYLDLPAVRSVLDAAMYHPPTTVNRDPFEIYDFVIIEGVKTLQDAWHGGGLETLVDLVKGDLTIDGYLEDTLQRVRGYAIGLDSSRYTETKPMIVAHGHQWDFWNCRENELVGKMISNMVGVPADQLLDPFVDARGIAWDGEPAVRFGAIAADMPVLNNWLATRQAVHFAHKIQHQSTADRLLVDDVMYMETVAALSATLGIEIDQPGDDDPDERLGAADYAGKPLDRFMALRFNQLCVGHTHFPKSQPYWDIESLLSPLGVGNLVRQVTSTLFAGWEPSLNVMRALYYNSGNSGWHEGVIWAIEITELGQARLVYWTHNSLEPETMDWELRGMPAAQRDELEARIDGVRDQVVTMLQSLGAQQALTAAAAVVSVPAAFVAGIVAQSSDNVELDLGAILADASIKAEKVVGNLQSMIGEFIMTALLRQADAAQPRSFTLRVPMPPGIEDALAGVTDLLNQMSDIDAAAIPKLACGWLMVVRNLPFFGGFESRRDVFGIDDRVFWVIVSLLFQLPSSQVPSSTLPLQADAAIDGSALVVTLVVG